MSDKTNTPETHGQTAADTRLAWITPDITVLLNNTVETGTVTFAESARPATFAVS